MNTSQSYISGLRNNSIRKLKLLRRRIYELRQYIPYLKELHELEAMVGPLGYWDKLQKYQISFLRSMGMKPHHNLLDVGCGPLQGGLAFIQYLDSQNYYGFDINDKKIQIAQTLVNKHQLSHKKPVIFTSTDFGKNHLEKKKFNFIWASQIIYYFDHNLITELFEQIAEVLNKNGKFYCDIIGKENVANTNNVWGYKLHSIDYLTSYCEIFGLQGRYIGQIHEYGYPKALTLKSNYMIEFSHA